MNKHKPVIDAWVVVVRDEWLVMKNNAILRASTSNLLQKVKERYGDYTKFDEAWEYIDKLEQLLSRFHDDGNIHVNETPQSFIDCGIAAYHMGNIRRAIRFMNVSIAKYTDQHEKAVSHWLLGCMYWCLDDSVEAIAEWENSLNQFEEQAKKTQKDAKYKTFYQEKTQIMRQAIQFAVGGKKSAPPDYVNVIEYLEKQKRLPPSKEVALIQEQQKSFITSIPILGEIPAGFPLGILPDADNFLRMQIFLLNDLSAEFYVRSLISGQQNVRLVQSKEYFILRVKGNSMNLSSPETILDGDYVLLRKQRTADNGEIVAAEITSPDAKDDRATLKRYKLKDGKILLVPESSDPSFSDPIYVDKEYNKADEEFHIHGIALAVFKKIPD